MATEKQETDESQEHGLTSISKQRSSLYEETDGEEICFSYSPTFNSSKPLAASYATIILGEEDDEDEDEDENEVSSVFKGSPKFFLVNNDGVSSIVDWRFSPINPRYLWPDAARWTAYVLNRSLTKALKDKVPEERWTGIKPKVHYLRVFGSVVHVHIPLQKRIKLDDRSHKCILLGVSEESKAYRLFDPVTKKYTFSRDVISEEDAKWMIERALLAMCS